MKQTLGELMHPEKDDREGRREKKLEARQLLVPYSGGLPALRPAEPVLSAGAAFRTPAVTSLGRPGLWEKL